MRCVRDISRNMTNMSVPSVIFAAEEEMPAEEEMAADGEMAAEEEAAPPTPWYDSGVVWYGSLRGAVVFGGADDDARITSGGSKWGIKGTSQVSEGLTAVYNFETGIDEDANQAGNVIYAGLSGGFGNLNIGKFHNASYLSGGIRDQGNAFGDSDVSTKVGNTVSYSYSSEVFTLQADAIMDNGTDTSKAVDEVQFGLSVNLGDIGKVAIAYEKKEDSMADGMAVEMASISNMGEGDIRLDSGIFDLNADGTVKNLDKIEWRTAKDRQIVEGKVSDVMYTHGTGASALTLMPVVVYHSTGDGNTDLGDDTPIKKVGDKYYIDNAGADNANNCVGAENKISEACTAKKAVWVVVKAPVEEAEGKNPKPTYATLTSNMVTDTDRIMATATVTPMETTYGYKRSHISAAIGLGGVTARLGHTSTDSNSPMMTAKAKTNFLGFTGTIGDTGMNWLAYGRNKEDHAGKETSPWGIGVGKTLGGGAYTYIEHENADDGNNGSTRIGLNIDF